MFRQFKCPRPQCVKLPVSNRNLDSVGPCFIILCSKNGTKMVLVFRRSVNTQTHSTWSSHGSLQVYNKMLFAFLIGTLISHEFYTVSQNFLIILILVWRFYLCTFYKYSLTVYYELITFPFIILMCLIYVLYS